MTKEKEVWIRVKLRKKDKTVEEIRKELQEIAESQKRAEKMLREAVIQLTKLNVEKDK